jgi:hypothetical protein
MSHGCPLRQHHPSAIGWRRRYQDWKETERWLQTNAQKETILEATLSSVKDDCGKAAITPDHMRKHAGVILKC